jgi:hypothetical protein
MTTNKIHTTTSVHQARTVLVKIMLTLWIICLLRIDGRHGWQIDTGAKKSGCRLDGSVRFPNRSTSKVCRTICRKRHTNLSVNIILTNPVFVTKLWPRSPWSIQTENQVTKLSKWSYLPTHGLTVWPKLKQHCETTQIAMLPHYVFIQRHWMRQWQAQTNDNITLNRNSCRNIKLHGLSLRANYTDRENAACQRS